MDRTWSVERDQAWLLWRLWNLLTPGGEAVFSNNAKGFRLADSSLPPFTIDDWTATTTDPDFERQPAHQCWLLTRPA
jgi:23S rRNA G2069 N7-methylase RlmK/C1962 C5-methylase RlmI